MWEVVLTTEQREFLKQVTLSTYRELEQKISAFMEHAPDKERETMMTDYTQPLLELMEVLENAKRAKRPRQRASKKTASRTKTVPRRAKSKR